MVLYLLVLDCLGDCDLNVKLLSVSREYFLFVYSLVLYLKNIDAGLLMLNIHIFNGFPYN